jgi:hypothetical protein
MHGISDRMQVPVDAPVRQNTFYRVSQRINA